MSSFNWSQLVLFFLPWHLVPVSPDISCITTSAGDDTGRRLSSKRRETFMCFVDQQHWTHWNGSQSTNFRVPEWTSWVRISKARTQRPTFLTGAYAIHMLGNSWRAGGSFLTLIQQSESKNEKSLKEKKRFKLFSRALDVHGSMLQGPKNLIILRV